DLGLYCGIIICDTALGALNGFGLFSQLGPDQRHGNQQRPHSLIIRRFRARASVRSLLSALAYNGMAVHQPRKGVTPLGGASSCRKGPAADSSGPIALLMPRVGPARSGSGLDDRLARSIRGPRGLRACTHKPGHEANVRSCTEPDPQRSSGRIRGTGFMEYPGRLTPV